MLPEFSATGILPPYGAYGAADWDGRSPYPTSLLGFAERFSTSLERVVLLQGFIEYRSQLHALGLTSGVQWIGGSFIEDCEKIRGRPPADIDVVTFMRPIGDDLEWGQLVQNHRALLTDADHTKATYNCDAYTAELNDEMLNDIAYYLTMFSHQRNTEAWKGIVQLELTDDDDTEALNLLLRRRQEWQ